MESMIRKNPVASVWIIFGILILVHGFEAIVVRMDETVAGENFINKIFGILVVFFVLRILGWKWRDIGFGARNFARCIGIGLTLALVSFALAYSAEILILKLQGHDIELGVFTTGFSLTGGSEIRKGAGFIIVCVFFNIINVIMEEGTFRGLFYRIVRTSRPKSYALLFQALLFGIWHIVTPLHNLLDGDIGVGAFIALGMGYIILAGMMGIKWGLLYRLTGSLYAGMADHFFNNCIATNLLHVLTEGSIDEMMIVRVVIAQLLSFAVILILWRKKVSLKQERNKDSIGEE